MPDPVGAARQLLRIEDLHAWYGESHILHGMGFAVGEGEVVTLLGRNGAGKTTTLRAIMGIVPQCRGSVVFRDREIAGLASNRIARLGIAYCPEERGIFASLDVEENLLLPPTVLPGGMSVGEIHAIFPNLMERRRSQGTKLSGGEQQMLAIGRALVARPRLLLFDEPSLGLAPKIVSQIFLTLRELKNEGKTILLVEQNARQALRVADHGYVLERGRIVYSGSGEELLKMPEVQRTYLGQSAA